MTLSGRLFPSSSISYWRGLTEPIESTTTDHDAPRRIPLHVETLISRPASPLRRRSTRGKMETSKNHKRNSSLLGSSAITPCGNASVPFDVGSGLCKPILGEIVVTPQIFLHHTNHPSGLAARQPGRSSSSSLAIQFAGDLPCYF